MKDKESAAYYPLFMKIKGRKCLVVGGGRVALRKVKSLLEQGGDVQVVSPVLCEGLAKLAGSGRIQAACREYASADLERAAVAIAATDDAAINRRVYEDAQARGVPVNTVDNPECSNFIVPSCVRSGDVTIAISTGGKSPATARKIRRDLERDLAARYAPLAQLAGEVRADLKSQGISLGGQEWERSLDLEYLVEMLEAGRHEEARQALTKGLLEASERTRGLELHLGMVGVNYSTMPVALREKFALCNEVDAGAAGMPGRAGRTDAIVLSTCNRTEVYMTGSEPGEAESQGLRYLAACTGVAEVEDSPWKDELQSLVYTYSNREAVEHLFCVASGLDSMIIGEYEILGQVRQALERAEKCGTPGLPLLGLFRQAVQVGRLVRDRTGISRNALSVSSVAIDLAARTVGDLSASRILVIGAGEAGRLVAKAARERGAHSIAVISRSTDRASVLAAALGGEAVPLMELPQELRKADIVIACTGAPHVILESTLISESMKSRPDRPMAVIDIAVPRDCEAEVGQVANVRLFNIDDLEDISRANKKLREQEMEKASAIIRAEVDRFAAWWRTVEVRDTVGDLVRRAESIRQSQLAMTLKKMPDLSPEERDNLEAMSKAMMQKLLHDPIRRLKGNHSYEPVLRDLFGLDNGIEP